MHGGEEEDYYEQEEDQQQRLREEEDDLAISSQSSRHSSIVDVNLGATQVANDFAIEEVETRSNNGEVLAGRAGSVLTDEPGQDGHNNRQSQSKEEEEEDNYSDDDDHHESNVVVVDNEIENQQGGEEAETTTKPEQEAEISEPPNTYDGLLVHAQAQYGHGDEPEGGEQHWSHHYQKVQQYEQEHQQAAEEGKGQSQPEQQKQEEEEEHYSDDDNEKEEESQQPQSALARDEEVEQVPPVIIHTHAAAHLQDEDAVGDMPPEDSQSQAYSDATFHSEAQHSTMSKAEEMALEDSYGSDFEQAGDIDRPFSAAATTDAVTSSRPPSSVAPSSRREKHGLDVRLREAKRQLAAAQEASGELEFRLENNAQDVKGRLLRQQLAEIKALVANPTDPNNTLLQKIKARRGNANKRQFMLSQLQQLEKEMGRLTAQQQEYRVRLSRRAEQKEREDHVVGGDISKVEANANANVSRLSTQVVEKGKKNLKLSKRLVKAKTDLETCERDVCKARHILKKAVGRRRDPNVIESVGLSELISIYDDVAKEIEKEEEEIVVSVAASVIGDIRASSPRSDKKRLKELSRLVHHMKDENGKMEERVIEAEQELQRSRAASKDIYSMKIKVSGLKRQLDVEKQEKAKAEGVKRKTQKKLTLLSNHIERLMVYIKHEAVAKSRAQDRCKRARKELQLLRRRSTELTRKMHAREELIIELKQGARLLEDQLRLMDNRYLELRGKLDYARTSSEAEKKRVKNEVEDISKRFDYVKAIFPREIDPHRLREQVDLLSRCASAEPSTLSGYGFDCEGGLPSINEQGSPRRRRSKRPVAVQQWEYPSMAELVKAPDPDPLDTPRAHLWSSAKIDLLTTRLKHYQKQPVKAIA